MKKHSASIIYVFTIPICYILLSVIMKGSVYAIDFNMVILIAVAALIGVILGNIINKRL